MMRYCIAYFTAAAMAFRLSRLFCCSSLYRCQSAIKAGNLAICFLGFSIRAEPGQLRKCAELGAMASLFDLASDKLKFDPSALAQLDCLAQELLGKKLAHDLFCLIERKKFNALHFEGLERGIVSLRVILEHLEVEDKWLDNDIIQTGLFLQIVDDILDYEHDIRHGDLNFLELSNASAWLTAFLQWDYQVQFRESLHPKVLLWMIRKARTSAQGLQATVLSSSRLRNPSQAGVTLET